MTNTNNEKLPEAPAFIDINPESPNFQIALDYAEELYRCLSDTQKDFAAKLIEDIECGYGTYIDECIHSWADDHVDIDTHHLYRWLMDCAESDEYMERAISEGLIDVSSGYTFFKHMQVAQYLWIDDEVNGDFGSVLQYVIVKVAANSYPYITDDQKAEIESMEAFDFETLDDIVNKIADIFEE